MTTLLKRKISDAAWERSRPYVRRVCLKMLGNAEDAEDMTQDVLIHASIRQNAFRGEGEETFQRFLCAIARYRCLNFLKTRKNLVALDDATEICENAADIANAIERIAFDEIAAAIPCGAARWDGLDARIWERIVRLTRDGAPFSWGRVAAAIEAAESVVIYRVRHRIAPALAQVHHNAGLNRRKRRRTDKTHPVSTP